MEGFAKADREFFVGNLRGVIKQQEALTEQISVHIDRPFSELSPIEACVLMMGCFEIGYTTPGGELWVSCPDMERVCQSYLADGGEIGRAHV